MVVVVVVVFGAILVKAEAALLQVGFDVIFVPFLQLLHRSWCRVMVVVMLGMLASFLDVS